MGENTKHVLMSQRLQLRDWRRKFSHRHFLSFFGGAFTCQLGRGQSPSLMKVVGRDRMGRQVVIGTMRERKSETYRWWQQKPSVRAALGSRLHKRHLCRVVVSTGMVHPSAFPDIPTCITWNTLLLLVLGIFFSKEISWRAAGTNHAWSPAVTNHTMRWAWTRLAGEGDFKRQTVSHSSELWKCETNRGKEQGIQSFSRSYPFAAKRSREKGRAIQKSVLPERDDFFFTATKASGEHKKQICTDSLVEKVHIEKYPPAPHRNHQGSTPPDSKSRRVVRHGFSYGLTPGLRWNKKASLVRIFSPIISCSYLNHRFFFSSVTVFCLEGEEIEKAKKKKKNF